MTPMRLTSESPARYNVWNEVHTAALEDYGISGRTSFVQGLAP
jgi:hypothetical protein